MNSQLSAHIVGHVIAAPRTFSLREGVGCDLRVLVTRRFYNSFGIPTTAETRVKVVTYDTVMAERLIRDYQMGAFVEIIADNVRVEKPWQNKQGEWVRGSAVFTLEKIRHVTVQTPESGEVLAGVSVAS
ncbi:hypothetical protein ACGFIV_32275 [Sphaerisporangium sp. NPDC049003]|uniref:hypothetical protein n=1 Tax=Sphaerisporangium sp. NPDC049003 TaxID=3364517 RepID=UPI0037105470